MVPEYFEGSVTKRTKDGNVVLSNTLDEGESLLTGETYEQVRDGALLSKSHDTNLTEGISDPEDVKGTMTLDATRTSTFAGEVDGYSNSGKKVSEDERDEHTKSGVEVDETPAKEDADKSDDKAEDETVLTTDETKTNTVGESQSDVNDDERQPAPTNSGAPATEDAPSEDGEANSGEQPTENTSVSTDGDDSASTLEAPKKSESKEKWFKYAEAKHAAEGTEFPYADDYEGVTKETLTTEYGA